MPRCAARAVEWFDSLGPERGPGCLVSPRPMAWLAIPSASCGTSDSPAAPADGRILSRRATSTADHSFALALMLLTARRELSRLVDWTVLERRIKLSPNRVGGGARDRVRCGLSDLHIYLS